MSAPTDHAPTERRTIQRLGAHAALHWLQDADHAFHVAARSGRTDAEVREECLQVLSRWLQHPAGE